MPSSHVSPSTSGLRTSPCPQLHSPWFAVSQVAQVLETMVYLQLGGWSTSVGVYARHRGRKHQGGNEGNSVIFKVVVDRNDCYFNGGCEDNVCLLLALFFTRKWYLLQYCDCMVKLFSVGNASSWHQDWQSSETGELFLTLLQLNDGPGTWGIPREKVSNIDTVQNKCSTQLHHLLLLGRGFWFWGWVIF